MSADINPRPLTSTLECHRLLRLVGRDGPGSKSAGASRLVGGPSESHTIR